MSNEGRRGVVAPLASLAIDDCGPSAAMRESPRRLVKRRSAILASILLMLPCACNEASAPPPSDVTPCPPLSVTQDGRPVVFDDAKAFHDPADDRFGISLLRDTTVPCEDIVTEMRHWGEREPESKLEVSVVLFPAAEMGRVAADGHNVFVRPFDVVHDGRASDHRIALCVPRPVTLETDRRGTLVVHGLVEGEYCGETPPKTEVGMIAEDECPELELRTDGRAVDGYQAWAYGEPGESLEVTVFVDTPAVSCEELAAGRNGRLVTIFADEEKGSLSGGGWLHGFRRARPVRFGTHPGDRVAVCVPQREEWDQGLGAIVGLVHARYCGRNPATPVQDIAR
jgi:hypothetical protein